MIYPRLMQALLPAISTKLSYVLSFLCGCGLTLTFAPYSAWWLSWFVLPLAFYLIEHSPRPVLAAWCFGLGWFGAGISWVHVSIATYGGLPLIASIGLMFLLAAYLALFPMLAFWLKARLFPTHPVLGLTLCWLAVEWVRSWMLTGFPWLSLGYSQTSAPWAHAAAWFGEIGLSTILVLTSALIAFGRSHRYRLIACTFPLMAYLLPITPGITATHNPFSLLLVQGNIKQELRWAPEEEDATMLKYMDLTRPYYETDLIIWPEAAIPAIEPMAQDYLANLDAALKFNQAGLITGIIDYHFDSRHFFNSLITLGQQQREQDEYRYGNSNRYNKHHLLPIGEFVPFQSLLRNIAPLFNLPMSSFSRGDYIQQPLKANGLTVTPAICYEIAYPNQLMANFQSNTDLILTVSNDAWFGNSHGPHQHLEIAQMRAIELGRPVARATNNGITAVITPDGFIEKRAPQFVATTLSARVDRYTGVTPYTHWGNRPLYLAAALIAAGLLLLRWIKRHPQKSQGFN